jgi:hypothetical protein
MKITRIDLEGLTGYYAVIRRRGKSIVIECLTPEFPQGRTVLIRAGDRPRLWQAAVELQEELDGYRGTNSDIEGYHRELERLTG